MEYVPIIDGTITYECPYSGKSYVLLCHSALHVPSIMNNVIPSCIMSDADVNVNDTPTIHVDIHIVQDHSIYFRDEDIRIPLSLHGIFSYFPSRSPTVQYVTEKSGSTVPNSQCLDLEFLLCNLCPK